MLREIRKLKGQWQNRCHRFLKNQKGTAAIEFAFLAPILILTYFGALEVSRAYLIKNKVETVSETVANLVAQGTTITQSQLDDIFTLSTSMLETDEEAKFNIVVTAVRTLPDPNTGDPKTKVTWSESKTGNDTRGQDDEYNELPDGMAENYETLIVTELYYDHTAIFEYVVKGTKKFDRRFITKPRYSLDIPCDDC